METTKKNKAETHAANFSTDTVLQSCGKDEPISIPDEPGLSQEELVSFCDKLISVRLPTYCKQFCYDNRYQYQCTVERKWGVAERDAPLCEWGNATYAWMLKDLCNLRRINKLGIPDRSAVMRYLGKVINSIPFRERFKDWRFQRRIRIPEYIKNLDVDAAKIFWWLCDSDNVKNIAQRLGRDEAETEILVSKINKELHKRQKGHLLKFEKVISLTSLSLPDNSNDEYEIPANDMSAEDREQRSQVNMAYRKLTWQEQYILDAMIVDDLSAKSVLRALVDQDVSVDEKIPVDELTVQRIYYFLRKTIAKLKFLSGID